MTFAWIPQVTADIPAPFPVGHYTQSGTTVLQDPDLRDKRSKGCSERSRN